MENNVLDGNENSQAVTGEDASTLQNTQPEIQNGSSQANSSAETVKPEESDYVPKKRFNQVYAELKKYKQIEQELSTQQELVQAYKQLDEMLAQDPDLFSQVSNAIKSKADKKTATPTKSEDKLEELQREILGLKVQRNAEKLYEVHTKNLQSIPENIRQTVDVMVERSILAEYGQNFMQISPDDYTRIFNDTVSLVKPFMSSEQQQSQQRPPATPKGMPAVKASKPQSMDRSSRIAFLAEGLKASRQS